MPRPNNYRGVNLPVLAQSTMAQHTLIANLFNQNGFNAPSRKDFLLTRFNLEFSDQLSKTQASKAIEELLSIQSRNR